MWISDSWPTLNIFGIVVDAKTFTIGDVSVEAMMLAVPAPCGVTSPVLSTVAILVSDDAQLTVAVIGWLF